VAEPLQTSSAAAAILERLDAMAAELASLRRLVSSSPSIRADGGLVAGWIEERCDLTDPAARTLAGELYADFVTWCQSRGAQTIATQTAFGRALRRHWIDFVKDGRGLRQRVGIRLAATPRDAGMGPDDTLRKPSVEPAVAKKSVALTRIDPAAGEASDGGFGP